MSTNVFKFLWKYLSKLKFLAFSVLLSVILGEISARVGLYYASQIIETISQSLPKNELIHIAAGFAFLASMFLLLKGVLVNVVIFIEANFLPRYGALIAKDLFIYAHKHSTAFFAEEMAGNISAKIKTMVDSSINIYYNLLWGFISPLVVMCVTFGFIFHINIELGLLMLVLNSILIWCIYILSRRLAPYSEKRAKLMSEANGCLIDSITNASLVKNFCNYIFEKNLYFKELRKAAEADKQETIQFGKLYLAQGISRAVLEAIFLALPLWYWFQDKVNIGQLVLIQTLIISLSGVYNMLSMQFMHFFKLYGGISDGLKLLSRPYEIIDVPNAKNLKLNTGKIDFCHLDYHYKNSEALFNDFSLQIKAGEKIGLVGRSGSGKSTLIKLLARHYDLQGGKICIDGQNIALVKQNSLRKYIAVIPQEPALFNRTIMENIRYGNLKATDEEVFEAAKKAYCHDFISALPHGYNSKVGERGVMLSGGERQRIAIARAILKNAPILILDEATSALDSESEHYIQDSLRNLMNGKTVIAIAHRLSTLKEMNKLVVMEKGHIIEQGSHDELLSQHGIYYNFYNLQSSGFLNIDSQKEQS